MCIRDRYGAGVGHRNAGYLRDVRRRAVVFDQDAVEYVDARLALSLIHILSIIPSSGFRR